MSAAAGHPRIETLEAGRGVAALLVLFSHTSSFLAVPEYLAYRPLGGAFDFGFVGVDYFFALSGFVIYYVNHRAIGVRGAVGPYLRRRVARIYPIYWALTAVLAVAYLTLPVARTGQEFLPGSLFTSLTLLPGGTTLVPTGWSLVHEVLFYLVFSSFLASPRIGAGVLALWFGGTIVLAVAGNTGQPMVDTVFYVRTLHFGFGMLAARLFVERRTGLPWAWIAGGALALAALWTATVAGALVLPQRVLYLALGAASAALILGLAEAELRGAIRTPAPLVFLGAASYAVYLVHYPVALVLTKAVLFAEVSAWAPPLAIFVVLSIATLVASILAHLVVERPLLAAARRILVHPVVTVSPHPTLGAP